MALAFGLTVLTWPLLLVTFLVVILTRRSLLVMGWRTFSGKRSRWLRNCPGVGGIVAAALLYLIASGKTGLTRQPAVLLLTVMASIRQAVIHAFRAGS